MKDLYETQSNLELNTGYTPLCCEVNGLFLVVGKKKRTIHVGGFRESN